VSQIRRISAEKYAGNVKQRRRGQILSKNAALTDVQPTRANPNDGFAGLNADVFIALLVEVTEFACQRLEYVGYARSLMLPFVGS
jgi:hypothetical protein